MLTIAGVSRTVRRAAPTPAQLARLRAEEARLAHELEATRAARIAAGERRDYAEAARLRYVAASLADDLEAIGERIAETRRALRMRDSGDDPPPRAA